MREFIYNAGARATAQDRIDIHLLSAAAAIGTPLRNCLQAFRPTHNIRPPVRLQESDDYVQSTGLQLPRVLDHLIGLADSRGVPEVDLKIASLYSVRHGIRSLVGKDPNIHAARGPHQPVHGAAEQAGPPIPLHAVSYKDLRDAVRAGILHDGVDGLVTFEHVYSHTGRLGARSKTANSCSA